MASRPRATWTLPTGIKQLVDQGMPMATLVNEQKWVPARVTRGFFGVIM
jgi:hypothetical protein